MALRMALQKERMHDSHLNIQEIKKLLEVELELELEKLKVQLE